VGAAHFGSQIYGTVVALHSMCCNALALAVLLNAMHRSVNEFIAGFKKLLIKSGKMLVPVEHHE
jgi:hypothetical protein